MIRGDRKQLENVFQGPLDGTGSEIGKTTAAVMLQCYPMSDRAKGKLSAESNRKLAALSNTQMSSNLSLLVRAAQNMVYRVAAGRGLVLNRSSLPEDDKIFTSTDPTTVLATPTRLALTARDDVRFTDILTLQRKLAVLYAAKKLGPAPALYKAGGEERFKDMKILEKEACRGPEFQVAKIYCADDTPCWHVQERAASHIPQANVLSNENKEKLKKN
jgi:hypothetical protein